VVLSKIGIAYTHPRLALATFADDLSVSYEHDPELVREALRPNTVKNILLFTHGIIGDTHDMTKAARLALTANGNPIDTTIDAILTFDYENLNTPIQENARLLKEALERVGINAHDTKNVTIIAHSMGGLITRWLVEKLHGDEFIDRVILCGTPNEGTPLADVRDAVEVLLTLALNGVSFLKPWLFAINVLGKLGNEVSVSFRQMDMVTGIYTQLNDKTDPRIPYTIIAGDIRQIGLNLTNEMTLLQKLFTRLGRAAKYELVDKFLFKASNDIAVGTKSIVSIPGSEHWSKPPVTFTVACDHLNYFVNPVSLSILGRLF
jgi:pimeloyl-ACP methyl ester carboxylesterase